MRRKIGVSIIALIATFSVVYGLNQDMSASGTYKPFNMNWGYSVYWTDLGGTITPSSGSQPIEWYVVANGFSDRVTSRDAPDDELTLFSKVPLSDPINADEATGAYGKTAVRTLLNTRFSDSTLSDIEKTIVEKKLVYDITSGASGGIVSAFAGTPRPIASTVEHPGDNAYLISTPELASSYDNHTATNVYFTSISEFNGLINSSANCILLRSRRSVAKDNLVAFYPKFNSISGLTVTEGISEGAVMQPAMQLDQSKISLATSMVDSESINRNSKNMVELKRTTKTDGMKIALKRSDVSISPLNSSVGTTKVTPSSLTLDYLLKSDSTIIKGNNRYISMVLTQKNSNNDDVIIYQGRVENLLNNASGKVNIDISYLTVGQVYDVKLYYEEVNTGVVQYNYASEVVDFGKIEIIPVSYSKLPQPPNAVEYEYDTNVDGGTTVGKYTYTGSSARITTDTNAPSGHTNDYLNFDFEPYSGDGRVVKIKNNAPDLVSGTSSLPAKDYYFCMVVAESGGDISETQICEKFTVKKIDPNLAFTNNSPTNTKTDMVYGGSITEPISFTNTDTSYSITYSVNNNIVKASTQASTNHASIVSNTSNATGLSTVTASIGESANFKAGTATRDINVYDTITAFTFTPVANIDASDTQNAGFKVGSVDVIGGNPTYKYSIAANPSGTSGANANGSSFQVATTPTSNTSMNITTTGQLSSGTYKVTFKIEDSYGQVNYIEASVVVNAIGQAAFDFYDYQNTTTIMSNQTIQIPYGTSNAKLLAKGGSGSGAITYAVISTDIGKGIISVNAVGDITIQKIGTVEVEATKAGSGIYQPVTVKMKVEIIPAYQTIAFNTIADTRHKLTGTPTFQEVATATLVGGGTPVGGIRYSSSNTGVVTVDQAGVVSVVGKGTATITAIINENVSANTSYDANYESKTTTKQVTIFSGASLVYVANTPNLRAIEDTPATPTGTAILNASVGSIQIVPGTGSGASTYIISTSSDPTNVDKGFFKVNANGILQLKQGISASDIRGHIGGNAFKVRVEYTDENGMESIDISVTIDDAKQNVYFTDMNAVKVNSISEVYKVSPNNTFQLYTHKLGSGAVTYKLKQGTSNAVVSVSSSGLVTILKETDKTTPEVVEIEATVVAADGYEGATVPINVVITPAPQTIAFKDITTVARTFVAGTTFTDDAQLKEGSTVVLRPIIYATSSPTVCTIDPNTGEVTMNTTGNCVITASNSDSNYIATTTSKTINFYTGMGASYNKPTTTPQAETPSGKIGKPMGSITVNGGQVGAKTFSIVTAGDPVKNADKAYIKVDASGSLSLVKDIIASDLAGKNDSVKDVYVLKVQVEVTDSLNNKVIVDVEVDFKGAPLLAEIDSGGLGKITETYSPAGTFNLNVINNTGGGVPNYRIKNDVNQPQDVLQSIIGSTVTILHANDKSPTGNLLPVMVEAVIPASNGYEAKIVEIEVEIKKAKQSNFKFKTPTMNLQTSQDFTPLLVGIESKQADGVTPQVPALSSTNTNVVKITGGTTLSTNTNEASNIQINAKVTGDRDYLDGVASAIVNVSSQPAYTLTITVPTATYGDTNLQATIFHNGATGLNQVQTWTSSDPTVATVDNNGDLTILNAGNTTIECKQTSDGEPSVTSGGLLTVHPKAISVTLDDKNKLVGEEMPSFTYQPITGLVGSDVITAPTFACIDTSGNSVISTTSSGVYPILGTYASGANPNYAITVVPGDLTINQDATLAAWYKLIGTLHNGWYNDDVKVELVQGSGSSYDEIGNVIGTWSPTEFVISSEGEIAENIYFHNTISGAYTSPANEVLKIDKTKPVIKSITGTQTNKDDISQFINKITFGAFFKPGTKVGIISEDLLPTANVKVSGVKEVVYNVYEIDKTTGNINPIAKDSGTLTPDATEKSEVTLADVGMYRVCAITTDHAGNESVESCSDLNIKKIGVDVDKDGELDFNDPDGDECPDLNIKWKQATNEWVELNIDKDGDNIPEVNIDSNGDGLADINVDTDEDGKPDLNLVILSEWKPSFCVIDQVESYCTMKDIVPVINVDTGTDGIPEINIDTKGDMIADYNIAKDGEEKPYLNIGKVHTTWTPDQDYKKDTFLFDSIGYHQPLLNVDTDKDGLPDVNVDFNNDGEPEINIDTTGDLIPDINIDGNGDGEADYNLDPDENGKPTKDIVVIDSWNPNIDGSKDGFAFDTIEIKRKADLEDQGVTVEKPGGSFLPNYSIKVENIKDTIDEVEKAKIEGFIKADTEIKDIIDVKLSDGISTIQPDGTVKVRIPVSDEIANSKTIKVVVEQKDGTYKEVEATIKDGYIEYETDYLGKVGIIAEKAIEEDPTPEPEPEPEPDIPIPNLKPATGGSTPETSVKGDYVSNVGGAGTGDNTSLLIWVSMLGMGIFSVYQAGKKLRKKQG